MRSLILLLLLSGCSNMTTVAGNDCWIFVGEASFRGRITESSIDGKAFVRKGQCTAADIAAALDATR